MACVIPFPAVRQAADRHEAFRACIAEIFSSAASEQPRSKQVMAANREEEIYRTLRRIERRLCEMERLTALSTRR